MPDNYIIRYRYNNEKLGRAASAHVFRYLSAFCGHKFVEDNDTPVIWRDTNQEIPASVKVILSSPVDNTESSGAREDGNKDCLFISPDPIERIFEKISVKTTFGPYSGTEHVPVNDPDESLGRIIKGFFGQLIENDIIKLKAEDISLWPGRHGFALAVTHDVDIIRRSIRGSIRLLFKRDVPGGFKGLLDSVKSFLGLAGNPYDRIVDWIDFEKRNGFKSTFFIFPGNREDKNDPKYQLNQLKKSIEYIEENGHELALHSGIECFRGDNIKESRKILSQSTGLSILGIRPHYLSVSLPEYWRAAAESGLEYTSCLGFDDRIGFYRGIDVPFIPFDTNNDTSLNIVEIPLAIMDCGLIEHHGASYPELLENAKELISRIKNVRGILVLDWHQRTMYNADYSGWAKIFSDLIDHARNEGAYFTTLGETARLLKNKMAGGD
ncbi:MAG: polysaccharide deacetylase family protein [Candidatus Zixiibacteriota bacterium]|nr:MAG: polysaccharide deacetylase family protein [candidate division Zixibacteria bacterium]